MEVDERRLIVALVSVFSLGILLSILNGYYIEETGSSLPLLTYFVAIVSIGVGVFVALLFQWRMIRRQNHDMLKILPDDERRIIEILLGQNRIDQGYLVAESGLSKVKVSRILAKLEQRKIVEKKPMGSANLIVLKI